MEITPESFKNLPETLQAGTVVCIRDEKFVLMQDLRAINGRCKVLAYSIPANKSDWLIWFKDIFDAVPNVYFSGWVSKTKTVFDYERQRVRMVLFK